MKRGLFIGLVVGVIVSMGVGSGYWAYAGQHMGKRGHMNKQGHHGSMMDGNQQKGMMGMPMMHSSMSRQEMNQYCQRMTKRHRSMMKMRRQQTEQLNSLVQSMKQASGPDKVQAMEKVLVELVEQHNKRGRMMMGSMRSMMGSMMGMHRMNKQQRQRMMQHMRDCPMMKQMMNRRHGQGTPMQSPREEEH